MTEQSPSLSGPDLAAGVPIEHLPEDVLFAAHAFGKPVVVVRRGATINAIGATCTHYSGPLAEGLLVGDTVRCPWHHACFSLSTGEALRAPALNPVAVWPIEVRDGLAYATKEPEVAEGAASIAKKAVSTPGGIVIVGGGAAGNAAAEMLRRQGHVGAITMITADDALPYDRPNLSKDYLAGNAPEDWIPLRPADFYDRHKIDTKVGARVTAINATAHSVTLSDGAVLTFDALLLATGAEPIRLTMPGGDLPHVHYLRTLTDSRRIVQAAANARTALVMGASFIGLEVAAALRTRGLAVHVVAPETQPLERVMGPELGAFIRSLHEKKGVVFHLGQSATAVDEKFVTLKNGERIEADLVVIGVGVRPAVGLAESAGIAVDRGVTVNEYLETSLPGIFAAGDIARWPDPHSGQAIRVEHWVVAERQGQTAARNMLGQKEKFDAVPFFWSAHYDTTISYVGHAEQWDTLSVDGDVPGGNATVTMQRAGRTLAVITVGRDAESLRAEVELEEQKI
jgi:NADPH-dependent 2,4-dienoyl-CoA reductase/sulfur reductase-like enzyme/nitrite reductase/ring-hydroxylating ferredoxin subunit